MTINLNRMLTGYIECMEFADCGPDHETHGLAFSAELLAEAKADCAAFIAACGEPLLDALADLAPEYSDERFGHDFWLTRNDHGAGFWDREELEPAAFPDAGIVFRLGDLLSAAAKRFGTVDLWPGEDGEVHRG